MTTLNPHASLGTIVVTYDCTDGPVGYIDEVQWGRYGGLKQSHPRPSAIIYYK